jgi:hypothetical protein
MGEMRRKSLLLRLGAGFVFGLGLSVRVNGGVLFSNVYFDPPGTGFFDSGNGSQRQAALQAAENIWSGLLPTSYSGETITVSVGFQSMGGTASSATLGAGNPSSFASNFTSGSPKFQSNTLYAAALANHLHGASLAGGAQITMTFNSDIGSAGVLGGDPFYYGTDGNPPANSFDFETIALHELNHGLGFVDSFTSSGGTLNATPYAMDRFLYRGSTSTFLLNEPSNSARLADLTSGDLFFNGTLADASNGGPVRMYAPGTFSAGSTGEHVDQSIFDLMNPTYPAVDHTPSQRDLGILGDIGWTTVPEPGVVSLLLISASVLVTRRR